MMVGGFVGGIAISSDSVENQNYVRFQSKREGERSGSGKGVCDAINIYTIFIPKSLFLVE